MREHVGVDAPHVDGLIHDDDPRVDLGHVLVDVLGHERVVRVEHPPDAGVVQIRPEGGVPVNDGVVVGVPDVVARLRRDDADAEDVEGVAVVSPDVLPEQRPGNIERVTVE